MSFAQLGLSPKIVEAVTAAGYTTPTPIQLQAIPAVLAGHDLMAAAQTGTGKTAGFTLPLLHKLAQGKPAKANQARALILTPTRELAIQVSDSVSTYGKQTGLVSTVVYGGVKINPQMMRLRKGVDILIATPGRLLDLYQQNAIRFDSLEVLVLDEADRMLDMGFIRDIKKILTYLPKQRQNLLFSATFSEDIRALAKGLVNQPVEISVSPKNTAATTVKQVIFPVDKSEKANLLIHLIQDKAWYQLLVFTRTKHGANRLATQLDKHGIKSAAIHGNKSQNARMKALNDFKENKIQVLVATDIAARGIDIDQLPSVVNFDLPHVSEDYVHRIGRTGRAGATGEAASLVSSDEFKELSGIENLINQILPREIVTGFEPKSVLPESKLGKFKPNRPKSPKSNDSNAPKKTWETNNTGGKKRHHPRPAAPRGHTPDDGTKPNRGGKPTRPADGHNANKRPNPYRGKRKTDNGSEA